MKKKLVWIVACTGLSVLGSSGIASARVIDKNKFKGMIAATSCSRNDSIVCDGGFAGSITTDIFMNGEEFVTRTDEFPPEAGNNLFVTVRKINSCTGEFLGSIGSLPHSSTQSLQSAHFQGLVPLRDFETELPVGNIAVNVNLQGVGPITKDKTKDKFEFPGPEGNTLVITIKLKGETRSGVASGTLVLDGNPVTCAFGNVTLMKTKNGDKTVERR